MEAFQVDAFHIFDKQWYSGQQIRTKRRQGRSYQLNPDSRGAWRDLYTSIRHSDLQKNLLAGSGSQADPAGRCQCLLSSRSAAPHVHR